MPNDKPQHPFESGPYIQAASFCEQVIEGKDGVLSLIRMVDRINVETRGPSAPAVMPPGITSLTLVLMLKSGDAKGRYDLRIEPQLPSGEIKTPIVQSVHMEPGQGQNIILRMQFPVEHEGQYWFNVFFDDHFFTRIPLQIRYTRIVTGAGPR